MRFFCGVAALCYNLQQKKFAFLVAVRLLLSPHIDNDEAITGKTAHGSKKVTRNKKKVKGSKNDE